MTWALYADPGLTNDLSTGVPVTQVLGGTYTDVVLYYGNPATNRVLQAASAPGADPITITPADASVSSGVETSMLKLALTSAGLDSATAGAALNVGAQLSSGVSNAVEVWLRVDAGALTAGSYTDASLDVVATVESDALPPPSPS